MLDLFRQGIDTLDAVLDGTTVLIVLFSMMAGVVVRAGTGSTPLTLCFVPGLLAGAWAAIYVVQSEGLQLAADRDVNILIAITTGEALAVLVIMICVRLLRRLTAAPDVTAVRR